MPRVDIPIRKFYLDPIKSLNGWFVLTAGENEPDKFNPMTVSWGSYGIMWENHILQVVVRPTRYTYEFLEKYGSFTVCAFPQAYQNALNLLGTKSGRDIDKVKESGLTPIPSSKIEAPGFAEAELIIECRKVYYHDIKPEQFIDSKLDSFYQNDYHRVYYGEIVAVSGTEGYMR